MDTTTFHYPPELLELLIDTIPKLFRSKKGVLLFFEGAGVPQRLVADLSEKVRVNPDDITKYDIVRVTLTRLNERGDTTLRQRREVLKRVVEFEDFSTCWPSDQLAAKGLVAEIRRVVNVKDTFTRINLERKAERKDHQAKQRAIAEQRQQADATLADIKRDLFALFGEKNSQRRGKALEGVLNRLFEFYNILVREAFTQVGSQGEGVIEQVDGVVEIDGETYLVEMKWWKKPLGRGEISEHLVRIYHRSQARGIFISAEGYTDPAITVCREALQKTVVVLCSLQEIVMLLDQGGDLKDFLKEKIRAAQIHKNPFYQPLTNKT